MYLLVKQWMSTFSLRSESKKGCDLLWRLFNIVCKPQPLQLRGENERKKEKANRVGNKNGNITFYPQITSMFVSIENTKGWRLPEWWQEKFDRPSPREASIQLVKIINTKYLKGNTHMKKYLFKKIE